MADALRTEGSVAARTKGLPATISSLTRDLKALGVPGGGTVLVHSSLSALGWVVGGEEAVILALESALGDPGTLLMPAHSLHAPEPALWTNPPVPESWWTLIRAEWPPYDRDLSPTRGLGRVAELFRHQRGTERSLHPSYSFSARGPNARPLLDGHSLDGGLGEGSPLARLYELDGWVLLLGVDHGANTSLHLAEYRAQWPSKQSGRPRAARFVRDGSVVQGEMQDLELNSDDFATIGQALERETTSVKTGTVGDGTGRLMRQRPAVDFAVAWMERNRR